MTIFHPRRPFDPPPKRVAIKTLVAMNRIPLPRRSSPVISSEAKRSREISYCFWNHRVCNFIERCLDFARHDNLSSATSIRFRTECVAIKNIGRNEPNSAAAPQISCHFERSEAESRNLLLFLLRNWFSVLPKQSRAKESPNDFPISRGQDYLAQELPHSTLFFLSPNTAAVAIEYYEEVIAC
jgi:hypothetical protein